MKRVPEKDMNEVEMKGKYLSKINKSRVRVLNITYKINTIILN